MVSTVQPKSVCFIYFDSRFEINIEAHRLITMLEWEATKCDYLTPGKQSVNKMSNNGFKDYKTTKFFTGWQQEPKLVHIMQKVSNQVF